MQTIAQHLARCLLLDDLPSTLLPTICCSDFGTDGTNEKQGDRFSEQVSIGRKVSRKIVLDVPTIDTEGPQPFVTEAR